MHHGDATRASRTRLLVVAAGILALAVTPMAFATGEGDPLEGGVRNPGANQTEELTRETEIIANTNSYGTRQSNKSDNGGGAIYGCRSGPGGSPANNEPCIRANNLRTGAAFEFETNGLVGGGIAVGQGGDNTRPFVTNATGVATGLNADRVDGRDATAFAVGTNGKANDADALDGRDSASFASAGDLRTAVVNGLGEVQRGRGVTGASLDATSFTYTVTFDRDVSTCVYTASPIGDSDADALGVDNGDQPTEVEVDAALALPSGFHLQVVC